MIVWSIREDPINEYKALGCKSRVKKSLGKTICEQISDKYNAKKSIGFHCLRRD